MMFLERGVTNILEAFFSRGGMAHFMCCKQKEDKNEKNKNKKDIKSIGNFRSIPYLSLIHI